jgi:hypothetical protein
MNTSQKFINSITWLFGEHMKAEEMDKKEQMSMWQRMNAIGNLMLNYKEYLYEDIKEANISMYGQFHNQIYNNMRNSYKDPYRRAEDGKLCQQEINSFGMIAEAILNPNYVVNSNTTIRLRRLIIYKYLSKVFFIWKSNPYSPNITQFNDLTKKYGFNFTPLLDYASYNSNFWKITDPNDLKIIIEWFKTNHKNDSIDVKPSNSQPKIPNISQSLKPTNQNKEKINLDSYKVVGLKELCIKYNLNTNKCRLRDDYIKLLEPYIENTN